MGSSPEVLHSAAGSRCNYSGSGNTKEMIVSRKNYNREPSSWSFLGGLATGCCVTYNGQLILSPFLPTTDLLSPNLFYFHPVFTKRIMYWLNLRVRFKLDLCDFSHSHCSWIYTRPCDLAPIGSGGRWEGRGRKEKGREEERRGEKEEKEKEREVWLLANKGC